MNRYATLTQVKLEIKTGDTETKQDRYINDALYFTSMRIEALTDMEFAPRIRSRYYNGLGQHIDDLLNVLHLGQTNPALEITSVLDVPSNQTLVEGTDFVVYPTGKMPIRKIRRLNRLSWSPLGTAGFNAWIEAIKVTGIWGFHSRYPDEAWLNSNDTVKLDINDTVTDFDVNDADGTDGLLRKPRFSPGSMLRVDDEFMLLLDVNTNSNILSVSRGANGSTAAAHLANTQIDVWQPEHDLNRAAIRWCAYLFARRGAFEQLSIDGGTTIQFPPDAPAEVMNILNQYGSRQFTAVEI